MAIDFCMWIKFDIAKDLHTDDGEDEEQHQDEQAHIRQGLKTTNN